MTYRILDPNEWHKLVPLFDSCNQSVPASEVSTAAVCEDSDGKIVACLMLQMAIHMEPLIIRDPHADFRQLHSLLEQHLSAHPGLVYYCFSSGEHVDRIIELCGLTKLPWSVW